MESGATRPVIGLHHITGIAGNPQANLNFYQGLLGQRLVKRTVNFDDPRTWHFYFADYAGTPGTVITFFPWARARQGVPGSGEATAVAWFAPEGSLPAWEARLRAAGLRVGAQGERFGRPFLPALDPHDLQIELVESASPPQVVAWPSGPVPAEMELRGFHSATLQVHDLQASAHLLQALFGWVEIGREGTRTRFEAPGEASHLPGRIIDLLETPGLPPGRLGAGILHHVAFRVPDDDAQVAWRERLAAQGVGVTPVRDRQYFRSIYFRDPNGILYEMATETPGFARDEPLEALGRSLKLPAWLEADRSAIASALPAVNG